VNFWGWLAGFFAAEGWFGYYLGRNHKPYVRLDVSQKEKEPLEVLMQFLGVGNIHLARNKVYEWYVYTLYGLAAESLYGTLVEQPMSDDWIRGFWEGDGSAYFGEPPYCYARVRFTQKSRRVLDEIRDYLGAGSVCECSGGYHRLTIYDGKKKLLLWLLEGAQSPRRRLQLEGYLGTKGGEVNGVCNT